MDNRIGRAGQIRIYVGKCFRLFVSEKQWINFISTAIITLIISMVTSEDMFRVYKDTKSGAFAVVCACIWVGLFNSIRSVCRERAIIKREHRTGLHISSYILAHVIYEFVLCMAESLIVTGIVFLKNSSHLPDSGLLFPMSVDFYITILLVMFGSDMIAILISSIVKSENTAMTVMPFILILQLVMAGAVFDLEGVTERIAAFTLSKWGLNAIGSISLTNSSMNTSYLIYGDGSWEASGGHLLYVWLIMLGFAFVYILFSIIALKRVDKDKR
ncbi:MAG: ABC transporter permease [Bacteroides thetaiotaomicron]|nr:ABC transporter permease [Bacteroides thetaiotaomicron]